MYWTIARCLFRPNMRKHATPSLQAITDAMMKNAKDQIPKDWLVEFVIALATCCDDAGDAAGAGKNANDALALVKDLPRSTQVNRPAFIVSFALSTLTRSRSRFASFGCACT